MTEVSLLPTTEDAGKLLAIHFLSFLDNKSKSMKHLNETQKYTYFLLKIKFYF